MRRLISCVLSLDLLGFHGSYQEWYQIFFLVGGIGWGNTYQTFQILFYCSWCGIYEGSAIGKHLRIYIVRETSCLLLFAVLCLIGLRLEDSHLVTPSFCSLVLYSLVINFLLCFLFFYSLFFFFCLYFVTLFFGTKLALSIEIFYL